MDNFIKFAIMDKNVNKIQQNFFSSKLLIRLLNYKKEREVEKFLHFYLQTPEIHENIKWFEEDLVRIKTYFPTFNLQPHIMLSKNIARRRLNF